MGRAGWVVAVVAVVALMMATLEVGAFAAFGWFESWPSREEVQQSLADPGSNDAPDADDAAVPERAPTNVAHPYLGYVRNPQRPRHRVNRLVVDETINEFGFFGPSPITPRREGVARVALTGGSVAEELFLYGRKTLREELTRSGAFGARDVEVISLALAGFKQPQQLMALSYLWVLGASFDAVINLDGFNEIVLPFTENVPNGLSPSFPFRWNTVAARGIDPPTATLITRLSELDEDLDRWRVFFGRGPLRQSSVVLAAWHVLRSRIEVERQVLAAELNETLAAAAEFGPALRGPTIEYDSTDLLFRDSVELWKRASVQLWHLSQSHHTPYLQFLQPNQYVVGSKSFEEAERKAARAPRSSATRAAVEISYPRLIREGARLREAGLPFVDLTQMFADASEPVYRDRCCHLLYSGYQILATRIARDLTTEILSSNSDTGPSNPR